MALPATFHGYCTPDYFVQCYDVRVICDYLSDTGTPVIDLETNPFQPGDLDNNATLLRILSQATHKLKMAVRQSNRYTLAMLDAMYADVDTDTSAGRRDEISRLVADLAYGLLISRRGLSLEEVKKLAPNYQEALDRLEALKKNQEIFDDANSVVAEAGVQVKAVSFDPSICQWKNEAAPLLGLGCGGCGTNSPIR